MAPRILLYSHDTYGLGHLRRSLLIAEHLVRKRPETAVLILTGSPRSHAFPLPRGVDLVKFPAVTKTQSGSYVSRTLPEPLPQLVRLRRAVLEAAAAAFKPDLLLVDHAPVGLAGELKGLLSSLDRRRPRPRLVLGLRDIVDAPDRVRTAWAADGVWECLERIYDAVLVYGDPRIRTTAAELGLPERFPGKVHFTGYVGRSLPRREPANGTQPEVLVCVGGGGDGHHVLRAYTAFLAAAPRPLPFRSVLVTGPFLSPARRAEIESRARATGQPVEVVTFTPHFEERLLRARAAVAMAGYNSVVELLAAAIPALLVPREHPRLEQCLRAERLAAHAPFTVVRAEALTPAGIAAFLERALVTPPMRSSLSLDGGRRAADLLHRFASHAREEARHVG